MQIKDEIIKQLKEIQNGKRNKNQRLVLLVKLANIYMSEGKKFTKFDIEKYSSINHKTGKTYYGTLRIFFEYLKVYNDLPNDNKIKQDMINTNTGLAGYYHKRPTKSKKIKDNDHCILIPLDPDHTLINTNIPLEVKKLLKEHLKQNPHMRISIMYRLKNKNIGKTEEIE